MKLLALVTILGLISGNETQLDPPRTCGQSELPHMTSFIVGGQPAKENYFPWQVALIHPEQKYVMCGGSLVLDPNNYIKVITAAHCVGKSPDITSFRVVFGMHSTEDTHVVIADASSVTVHKDYNSRRLSNDIAIIEFGNMHYSTLASYTAAPICLPTRPHNHDERSVVSGWGTTTSGGSSSPVLQYVFKPLLSNPQCELTGNGGHIDETMLCAGETGKDACQGDSGGPLVAYRNGAWELVGVVSWGFGCGDDNYPGVYADVFHLKDWINTVLGY